MRKQLLYVIFLLTIAFAANWSFRVTASANPQFYKNAGIIRAFPERLRSFLAGYLWSRADSLMHRGPAADSPQNYQAGSYAGNTDILPLLQLVIMLAPEEIAPYQLLARNMALHLKLPDRALRVLQLGIISNRKNPNIHELFAAAAHIRLFTVDGSGNRNLDSALKYISKAISLWPESSVETYSDPAFSLAGYSIFKARILVELQRSEEALTAWKQSGLNLDNEKDRLAVLLRQYRDSGRQVSAADFPEFSEVEDAQALQTETRLNSSAEKVANEHNSLPFWPSLKLVMGAGLLFLLLKAVAVSRFLNSEAVSHG